MTRVRKNIDCVTCTIEICAEALKAVHKRQGEALINTGSKISMATAINKILIDSIKK